MNVVLHPVVASTYICCADHNFHHFTTINESKNLRMRKSKFSELQSLPNLWSLLYFQSAVTILWWLQMATYCICTVIHVELRFFSLAHTSYQMSDLYLSLTTKVKLYHFSQICLREISFKVDLMILMDFSQIPQSAISLADLMTFTIFINCMHFWTHLYSLYTYLITLVRP